jgi:hypothetical protein
LIYYYKTQSEEWGTPFSHSCSDDTGIAETKSNPITIYPSPADDMIHIKSSQKLDGVKIFDLQGRMVKQFVISSSHANLNVSNLEAGVYLIEVLNGNKALLHQKVIIK